jgi:hypothetical protein
MVVYLGIFIPWVIKTKQAWLAKHRRLMANLWVVVFAGIALTKLSGLWFRR